LSVIEATDLSKYYGKTIGIVKASFAVEEGEVWAMLGPQMSGKSTVLRLICGLIRPTYGSYSLFNISHCFDNRQIKKHIGFAPSHPCGYGELKVRDYLLFSARCYGIKRRGTSIEDAIDRDCYYLRLDQKQRIENLSFSSRKKAAIIASLIHKPRLAMLDEPTLGMDSFDREKILELMREYSNDGTTIVYTTRNVYDCREFSTHTAMMSDGIFIGGGRTEDIAVLRTLHVTVSADERNSELAEELGIRNYTVSDRYISFSFTGYPDELIAILGRYSIKTIKIDEPSTESIVASAAASKGVAV
jgi:ABC-2 type transport system ATP-binding protein